MPSESGAQCTPLWQRGARQRLRTATRWPRRTNASASAANAVSAPPSGPRSALAPSKAIPSSAITTSAIIGSDFLPLCARGGGGGARGNRGIELGFEIGEDRAEGGAERGEKTVRSFAGSFPTRGAF